MRWCDCKSVCQFSVFYASHLVKFHLKRINVDFSPAAINIIALAGLTKLLWTHSYFPLILLRIKCFDSKHAQHHINVKRSLDSGISKTLIIRCAFFFSFNAFNYRFIDNSTNEPQCHFLNVGNYKNMRFSLPPNWFVRLMTVALFIICHCSIEH